jgi:hypothetical protein
MLYVLHHERRDEKDFFFGVYLVLFFLACNFFFNFLFNHVNRQQAVHLKSRQLRNHRRVQLHNPVFLILMSYRWKNTIRRWNSDGNAPAKVRQHFPCLIKVYSKPSMHKFSVATVHHSYTFQLPTVTIIRLYTSSVSLRLTKHYTKQEHGGV